MRQPADRSDKLLYDITERGVVVQRGGTGWVQVLDGGETLGVTRSARSLIDRGLVRENCDGHLIPAPSLVEPAPAPAEPVRTYVIRDAGVPVYIYGREALREALRVRGVPTGALNREVGAFWRPVTPTRAQGMLLRALHGDELDVRAAVLCERMGMKPATLHACMVVGWIGPDYRITLPGRGAIGIAELTPVEMKPALPVVGDVVRGNRSLIYFEVIDDRAGSDGMIRIAPIAIEGDARWVTWDAGLMSVMDRPVADVTVIEGWSYSIEWLAVAGPGWQYPMGKGVIILMGPDRTPRLVWSGSLLGGEHPAGAIAVGDPIRVNGQAYRVVWSREDDEMPALERILFL